VIHVVNNPVGILSNSLVILQISKLGQMRVNEFGRSSLLGGPCLLPVVIEEWPEDEVFVVFDFSFDDFQHLYQL